MSNLTVWMKEDPRLSVSKRADIVVLYRVDNGWAPAVASVETHHGYNILFHHPMPWPEGAPQSVLEGDDWNADWRWTYAPELTT